MTFDTVIPLIVGPFGGLVVALLLAFVLYRELQAERRRTDRLDDVTDGALSATKSILDRTELVLSNHEEMKAMLVAIRAEQDHAKERVEWRK